MRPSFAWRIWQVTGRSLSKRYDRALHTPTLTRARVLQAILRHTQGSHFASQHGLHSGLRPADFAERVPIMDAAALALATTAIRAGAKNVLFGSPTERLVPTSGSTGPAKLIPMCAASRREYAQAVTLWGADLLRCAPGIRQGRAYIATSPALDSPYNDAAVPVGYAEDEAYLGPIERRILGSLIVVPTTVAQLRGAAWRETVRQRLFDATDLSLLSLWHPGYLAALFDANECAQLAGRWSKLKVISCWADGACRTAAEQLCARFPGARLHAKGLWLTEGVVTIPWRGHHPLALLNGYHEFEDESGTAVPFESLQKGARYRILLTNFAGLYRYRLGDLVEVTDYLHATPCLRWVGRADSVADLCGEKLSEAQIERAFARAGITGDAHLVPVRDTQPPAYQLVTSDSTPDIDALEAALQDNPHYRWARQLGQLGPITQCHRKTDATPSSVHPHRKSSRLVP